MAKNKVTKKRLLWFKRKRAIRKKIFGTKEVPRISVYRSLKHIYAQVIDDTVGCTLASASTLQHDFIVQKKENMKRTEEAFLVGKNIAKVCLEKNIQKVCFDRNGLHFHGRVKSLAAGARKGGLKF